MTEYHDKTTAQVRRQLTEALQQVDRGRNIKRDASSCNEHLDHAQAAADAATAALQAGDLDAAERQINIGFTELAVYEYCLVTTS
jgi:hypothetical protein